MSTTCSCGSADCGCCSGIAVAVPASEVNPPGQSALRYRVGTYATFYETMVARLSGFKLTIADASGNAQTLTPLTALTTRDPSDPTLALLDAWATVADVLTFYQERIANEGYLATAIQLRSVLELGKLIGYRARPGVAAGVKLAFTVATGFQGSIPAGTRAQSIPQAGQNPQFFETSTAFDARDTWNTLSPQLTRSQLITPAASDANGVPLVTGADVIDTIYFDGIATQLSAGNALFFIFGPDTSQTTKPLEQYLRLVADVNAQAQQQRTEVTLAMVVPADRDITTELQLYANDASYLFPGSDLATQVYNVLQAVIANLGKGAPAATLRAMLQAAAARLGLIRGVAVQRGFTRLAAWLGNLLKVVQWASLAGGSTVLKFGAPGRQTLSFTALPKALSSAPLANLDAAVGQLDVPRSVQPANAYRLQRTVSTSFAPQSDLAPRLLAALHPIAAPLLYAAYSGLATPTGSVEVYAARVKAGLFAANWTGAATYSNGTTTFTEPSISTAWGGAAAQIDTGIAELPLDTTYDQIEPGSWVAVVRPAVAVAGLSAATTFHVATSLRIANLIANPGGFAAKVTLLTLQPPWLSDLTAGQRRPALDATVLLHETIVYAQAEPLTVTEEPLDTDIGGSKIDLDDVYDGLKAGQWVIVSGTRTDIPNVGGVTAAELAMVAGVAQGTEAPLCVVWPLSAPPFTTIFYTTDADAFGARLVVGTLANLALPQGLPTPSFINQEFCDQVELAIGVYANAYVPTAAELGGSFPTFSGLLVDPVTNVPFEGGVIPPSRTDGLFAWRISSDAVHTILTLASPLAYSYDRSSITIYGNVVDATQGQSTGEVLGNGDGTVAYPTFSLSQSPLTYVSAGTPSGVSSTLSVQVNELEWTEVNDLTEASPTDRVFITSEDDSGDTSIMFGNGVHGRRLPTGTANVKATYRYGMGSPGNVAAGQISQLATMPLGVQGVINPLPATGGADADPIERARANAPMAVMALDRLVSVEDYADFARTYAGIGKAISAKLTDGLKQFVHVTVAGAEDIPIDTTSDLYANLLQSLRSYGDPFLPVEVDICRVRLLVIAASVGLQPDYVWDDVAPNATAAMQALFAFDARALGQTAYRSEAVAAIQEVEGVAWVNITTFDSVGQSVTAAQLAALAGTLRLRNYVPAALAEVNTKAAPGSTDRILPAELVFMTSDIPETLILTPSV
jgi:Baseplate J-like protein